LLVEGMSWIVLISVPSILFWFLPVHMQLNQNLLYFCFFFISQHVSIYPATIRSTRCLRSLLCFPFNVSDASRCFIEVMLCHAFMSNNKFGLCLLNMLLSCICSGWFHVIPMYFVFWLHSHLLNCLPVPVGWEEFSRWLYILCWHPNRSYYLLELRNNITLILIFVCVTAQD
jgi:hypothetical protein